MTLDPSVESKTDMHILINQPVGAWVHTSSVNNAKTYYFCLSSVFDTLIMTCATSITVMFSKAFNFTKDKSKSDYAYSHLELNICIRSQWSPTVTDDAV